MKIELTPELMTHVGLIDDQHQELFNRINAVVGLGISSATKQETDKTIDFLGTYIRKHFGDEEVLQQKSGYPKYEWHHGQHEYYINEFEKLKEEYAKNGPSIEFTFRLNKSIIGWLVNHIRTVDVELGQYLNDHPVSA